MLFDEKCICHHALPLSCLQTQAQLKAANAAKEKAERDASALKEQSSSMNREYDRLLAEHDMAQRKLARLEPGQAPSSRKDD